MRGDKHMIKEGDYAYILESNRIPREVIIKKITGDMVTVQFRDTGGAIRIRNNRVYETKEEVRKKLGAPPKSIKNTPYYDH